MTAGAFEWPGVSFQLKEQVGELVTPTGRLIVPAGADHGVWLEARRKRDEVPGGYCVGSSDVPSILDLEGVGTPPHVFRNKVYNIDSPVNEAMEWGHIFEPPIAEEWCRRNRAVIDEIGLVSNVDEPWHQSTIDRRVRHCPVYRDTEEACGLEVKNVGFASASRWHRDIPDRILAQIVHQLLVTGYKHIHYACNIGGNMMRQGIVYADRERELMAYIRTAVNEFRSRFLLTEIEPPWDTTGKAAKLIELDNATHPERVGELDLDGIDAVLSYAEAQHAESVAKKAKEQAKARLAQLANGARYLIFSDELAYSYGESKRTNVDLDALKERHPDAYDDPEVVSEKTSYTLRIAKKYTIKKEK